MDANAVFLYLQQSAVQPEESGDEDDEVDVSEEVEEVLGKLLEALGDKDTVVRWSAAKGVSRLTARLPKVAAWKLLIPE